MKRFSVIFFLLFSICLQLKSQTAYNPFTQNIHFIPEPNAFGFQCGSTPSVEFTQGMTTANDATLWQTEPLIVKICIGGFVFNGASSTSIVSGTYASNFTWSFDSIQPNCLVGIQNQTLPGTGFNPIFPNPLSSGNILVALKVPDLSPVATVLSVNVTLFVPSYMATFNSVPDDNESTQTQTFCGCYPATNAGAINGNQTLCGSGDPITFTSVAAATGGTGGTILYQWQENISGVWFDIPGATSDTYDPSFTSTARTYRRNAKRSLCGDWLSSDSLMITINSLPVVDAGVNKSLTCLVTSAEIGTNGISGYSYNWVPSAGLNSSSLAMPVANPGSTTVYTVTATGINGCSASDIVTVQVNNSPPLINAGTDQTLNCIVLSTGIGMPAVFGQSYQWSPTNGLNSSTSSSPVANPSATTTYTLTVTDANGCIASDDVIVHVDNSPPSANAGPDFNLNCSVNAAILGNSGIVGYNYTWTPASGLDNANIAQPTASPLASTTYTLQVTGSNGCVATDVTQVNVNAIPPNANAGPDRFLNCFANTTTLGSSPTAGNSYSWSPSTGLNSANIAQPSASPGVTTVYTLTVTDVNGCSGSDTVRVTVVALIPTADAGPDLNLCFGMSDSIGSAAVASNSYEWSPALGLSSNSVARPLAQPQMTTTYTVTVTNGFGCTATDVVVVNVNDCNVTISGTVYNDTNELFNLRIDGVPIFNPDSTNLYVSLVNNQGVVIATSPVANDGTYQFNNVPPNQLYSIVLSTIAGVLLALPPDPILPGFWENIGEDCCDQLGDDGKADGINMVQVGVQSLSNVNFGIRNPGPTGLPIDLKSMTLLELQCNVILEWITSMEQNTAYTDIFRKEDKKPEFKKIARVAAAGNSQQETQYAYRDSEVTAGTTYQYQLYFVDIDQSYSVSPVKSIRLGCDISDATINVYPNPSRDLLSIVYSNQSVDGLMYFNLLDLAGRKVRSVSSELNGGFMSITIDMSTLSSGNYFLHYSDEDNLFKGVVRVVKE